MTRNYLFARGINIIALAHLYIVNLLFCCPCLCVCLDCPQNITLMFIFQQFFTKICCIYYNIRNFVSVKLLKNTVVLSTTITFVSLQFISQNKKDPFRGIIPRYLTLSTLSGKKKTGNCEENRSFVECGVNFLDYVYFWFLNKFCIQELSLLYGLIVLKSTTFCTKIL